MKLTAKLEVFNASTHEINYYKDPWTIAHHVQIHGLPIGRIAQRAEEHGFFSADSAREFLNVNFADYGPIVHLALAPHPTHDIVKVLDKIPMENVTVVADGVICPINQNPPRMVFATLVGDCPTIMVMGISKIAFLHAGSPEIFDGLMKSFDEAWGTEPIEYVSIGPGIRAKNYELPIEKIPGYYWKFMADLGTENRKGFDCLLAIRDVFDQMGVKDVAFSSIDPFEENEKHPGSPVWASHRWWNNRKGLCSPRDVAAVFVSPGPNWGSPGHDLL